VPTVLGPIKGKYTVDDAKLQTYEIEIPGNMVAEFSLNNLEAKDLIHNGEKLLNANQIIRLTPGKHTIELKN